MTPGETAFIRRGASSRDKIGTISSRAPLIAASPAVPGNFAVALMAVIRVMLPVGRI